MRSDGHAFTNIVEALHSQVVHEVVGVIRRDVAGGTLGLAREERLAAHLALGGLAGVESAQVVELRCGRKVEQRLELGHEMHLAAALEDVHPLGLRLRRVAVEIGGALLEGGQGAKEQRILSLVFIVVSIRVGCCTLCPWCSLTVLENRLFLFVDLLFSGV